MPTTGINLKPFPPLRQSGLSLIELMISITIGLILLVGITSLIVQQSSNRDELEKSSRQIENGRYAMQIMHDDIEHAGLFGSYYPVSTSTVAQVAPADPCNISLGSALSGWDNSASSVPTAIFGYYQPASGASADPTTATSCGLSNYKPNTSILVVRRTATTPVAAAVAGTPYLQTSGCNSESANTPFFYSVGAPGTTLHMKDCATSAPLLPYMVNIYYISSCDAISAAGVCLDSIPTLKMKQAGAPLPPATTAPLTLIPQVEGIENMQFDYGLDTDGDGYPDTYTINPALGDWQNVVSIRLNLLARNTDPTTGYQSNKTFCLSGSPPLQASGLPTTCNVGGAMLVGPFGDTYKRHLFNGLVRVVNPSARRALQ